MQLRCTTCCHLLSTGRSPTPRPAVHMRAPCPAGQLIAQAEAEEVPGYDLILAHGWFNM